jgi:hypothetical protein
MKRLPLMLLLAAGLAAATAQAQTAADPAPAAPPSTAQEAPKATPEVPATDSDRKPLSDTTCLRETGSRITKRAGKPRCTAQPGRVYSKDDIDRTGYTSLGDALRALDPSIR